MEEDKPSTTEKDDNRSPSPDSLTIQTASTTPASTLTEDLSTDVAASLEQLMLKNPELAQQLYLKNSQILSKTAAVSPSEGVDGN